MIHYWIHLLKLLTIIIIIIHIIQTNLLKDKWWFIYNFKHQLYKTPSLGLRLDLGLLGLDLELVGHDMEIYKLH